MMTLKEFYFWLQGYLASSDPDVVVIRNKMKDVNMNPPLEYPYIPTHKWMETKNPSHCTKCGLNIDTATGYVCINAECPTGLGGIKC